MAVAMNLLAYLTYHKDKFEQRFILNRTFLASAAFCGSNLPGIHEGLTLSTNVK